MPNILDDHVEAQQKPYSMILGVPVKVSVELGRKKLSIKELISLKPGSVIEFSDNIDDFLKIYVNDVLFAYGEFTIINDRLSVRITDVLNHE